MSVDVNAITGLISAGVGGSVLTLVGKAVQSWLARRELRAQQMIIGVVNGPVPEVLKSYRDFTDFKKAVHSGLRVCILHCRTLSFALSHCDFVVADSDKDPKIIKYSDTDRLNAIVAGLPQ